MDDDLADVIMPIVSLPVWSRFVAGSGFFVVLHHFFIFHLIYQLFVEVLRGINELLIIIIIFFWSRVWLTSWHFDPEDEGFENKHDWDTDQ